MPQLSLRLSVIASLVPNGARVCDIGTDHGYLAIELIRSGRAESVIAADIGEKPLANARKNIENSKISGIELRLCDGLSGIEPYETDTVIIAGMGGEVISGILERGKNVCARKGVNILLQPTTSPEALRSFLIQSGYLIETEIPILENGKLYSVMKVKYTADKVKCIDGFYYVGKVTPETDAGMLYIDKQLNRCAKCAAALKGIPEKQADYLHYKSAAEGITAYIKSFGEK